MLQLFGQSGGVLLKGARCLDKFRDVAPKLLEGRKLSSSKIVPMPLVDAEQINKQENRIVLP